MPEKQNVEERYFQRKLIKTIKSMFPGCYVMKTNANVIQGFPDLLILFKDRWAVLECKRSADASRRPNQEYYIDILGKMSYAAFIYPENRKEILNELRKFFLGPKRKTRVARSK